MTRRRVELHPLGDAQAFQDLALVLMSQGKRLRDLLAAAPALSLTPLDADIATLLDTPLDRLIIKTMQVDARTPLYRFDVAPQPHRDRRLDATVTAAPASAAMQRPLALSEDEAVGRAHAEDIERVASYLRAGLSVLVFCDKLVVRHLWPRIVRAAGREPLELEQPGVDAAAPAPQGLRRRQLDRLGDLLADMKRGQVLVLPYLDLLGGGGERTLTPDARTLAELLYEWPDRPLLAFADRTLPLAPVIADRFAIRPEILGVPRDVPGPGRARIVLGDALVTRDEAACFDGYDPAALFKNVAGLNPLRLRHALAYAVEQAHALGHGPHRPAPALLLHAAIRAFKVQTSAAFEIPHITMDDIGGYDDVKAVLERALSLMAGAWKLPDEALRRELIPRGLLLHGPRARARRCLPGPWPTASKPRCAWSRARRSRTSTWARASATCARSSPRPGATRPA